MTKLNFDKKDSSHSIEITIQIRDKNGNPTGKTKTFGGKNYKDAGDWYEKQKPRKKKRRRKKKEAKK